MLRNAYWGEYPLSFAACLGQEECVRLLHAKDADVNQKDTNGNTALHMVVIHDHEVRIMAVSSLSVFLSLIFVILPENHLT